MKKKQPVSSVVPRKLISRYHENILGHEAMCRIKNNYTTSLEEHNLVEVRAADIEY